MHKCQMYKKSRLFLVALSSRFYYNFGFLHCKQCFVLINMLLDPKYVSLLILKAYFGNLSPLKLVRGTQHLSCVSWIACHLLYIHNISIINYVFGIPNIILINPLLYICLYSFATVSTFYLISFAAQHLLGEFLTLNFIKSLGHWPIIVWLDFHC